MTLLEQLGKKVDARLDAHGVVLTQGGEPTYVPLQPDAPEWNNEALGREKLQYARRLAARLVQTWFHGAAVVRQQGKLYPGEALPRWSLVLYRRRDARPLWKDMQRLRLDPALPAVTDRSIPERFLQRLAGVLGVKEEPVPAYEDVIGWLWRHHPAEAARLRVVVERGSARAQLKGEADIARLAGWEKVAAPAGWVLPLDFGEDGWRGGRWSLPGEPQLNLMGGESAIGLRLPLHRLPPDSVRRAITAELRDGEFVVFLPPLPDFASFAELLSHVERVVTELTLPPLSLEGYPPIFDLAWESLGLTSDPGVLEVNLPPAVSFGELHRSLMALDDAAQEAGLCARKFQFNGAETGTGGGSHVLFGGPSLEDNPFVRRPNLLASLIRMLVTHPSLSYCFTGAYLGPSCQAPRPDETVPGLLDELDIALRVLDTLRAPADPGFIDRLLRSLLLDWHGNTHRAELCVDKFCNPLTPGGRLGVIELRAIEMLPDVELNVAVNLLFRALLAGFFDRPLTGPLVRHGDGLHDRYLLPRVLEQDLGAVLALLHERGLELPYDLFRPILEFRMPVVATWRGDGVAFEIRQALEVWSALGDTGGATSRRVDAATDRLQVRLSGEDAPHCQVAVNGWRVPMHEIGDGERVAGIRYQAFANDHGLNPQLRPQLPLRFELLEPGGNRRLTSWEYSPWRRDGGYYPGRPRDRAEAGRRRAERVREVPDAGDLSGLREPVHARPGRMTFDLRLERA